MPSGLYISNATLPFYLYNTVSLHCLYQTDTHSLYLQGMVKYDDISTMLLFLITNTMKKPFLIDIFVYGSGPRGS